MKLRCVMAWQNYRKGDVIEPRSRRHCEMFLAMRWAGRPYWEPVPETVPEPVPEPPAAPAAQTARKRQRVAT